MMGGAITMICLAVIDPNACIVASSLAPNGAQAIW